MLVQFVSAQPKLATNTSRLRYLILGFLNLLKSVTQLILIVANVLTLALWREDSGVTSAHGRTRERIEGSFFRVSSLVVSMQ